MNKKTLSERDICTKYITPALVKAGWDLDLQVREEYSLTAGRVLVKGKLVSRAKSLRADYVLFHKPNLPIAVIEAKDNNHNLGDGMQQGLSYSEMLQVPSVFSSNGDGFLEHDKTQSTGTIERELSLNAFPSPAELWERFKTYRGITDSSLPAHYPAVTILKRQARPRVIIK